MNRALAGLAALALMLAGIGSARAGSIFVSGHDPDFHGAVGGNFAGAQDIIKQALIFARNGNTNPILLVETSPAPNNALGDHTDSEVGLINSGYSAATTPGNHYVKVSATAFATANLSLYSAIFVPSDHGGSLTGDDLKAIDARSADILDYLNNNNGGLVAFAEDGHHAPATVGPQPKLFGFLPFLATSAPLSEAENGNTLTAFGSSLGLLNSDINGNFSHNIFTATGGMTVVDIDHGGEILSLGYRGQIGDRGVTGVPEPSCLALLGIGAASLTGYRLRRRNQHAMA